MVYILNIGKVGVKPNYKYDIRYQSGKSQKIVTLSIYKNGLSLEFDLSSSTLTEVYFYGCSNNVAYFAIKRSLFLYFLLKGKQFKSTDLVSLYRENLLISQKSYSDFPFWTLFTEVEKQMPYNFVSSDLADIVLNYQTGSLKEMVIPVLTSFLYARSKEYEYEKFQNYWMAFNGLYALLYKIHYNVSYKKDVDAINNILQFEKIGQSKIQKKDSDKIAKYVISQLDATKFSTKNFESFVNQNNYHLDFQTIEDYLFNNCPQFKKIFLANGDVVDSSGVVVAKESVVGYFLCDLTYYLRCQFFHANRPIPLILGRNDFILDIMEICNVLLDHYLLNAIPKIATML